MTTPTNEEYLARAEFAGRVLGAKLRGDSATLIVTALEAIQRGLIQEWMIASGMDERARQVVPTAEEPA